MNTLFLDACAGSAQIVKCGCDIANATNGHDVLIAKEICSSIVTLSGIIVGGFLIWKLLDHIANGISGLYKRYCGQKDRVEKQNADLKGRLLDFLEKNTSEEDSCKEKDKSINSKKKFDSAGSQNYIKVLKHFVGDDSLPE